MSRAIGRGGSPELHGENRNDENGNKSSQLEIRGRYRRREPLPVVILSHCFADLIASHVRARVTTRTQNPEMCPRAREWRFPLACTCVLAIQLLITGCLSPSSLGYEYSRENSPRSAGAPFT